MHPLYECALVVTPFRLVIWIFVGSTLTWMFWNGIFAMVRFVLTGTVAS